ncbi:hypothetical protein CANARDRAFT_29386 [[Candida] arabinofermentans NRRL YB-2248]|uniref:Plectin/eS10 N-terminal domain-containing protein n=1 Tax=[Candida] arabinofermentans NRRL YB-2248 TaxID=983967 RepID=A0A1E4SXM3_9ASCO|nr:hypothetical protein CANARDRAFT_29386 [[Candida] arabinofermentans NRRL YB-2248]
MLIPKEDRNKIYQYLFKEGVLVAMKNFEVQHEEIDTKNLFVIKAMQSLTSKGFVKTQFSWQSYYYTLTDEGLEYLREYLNLPEGIVPKTLVVDAAPAPTRRSNGPRREDGEAYRRRERV